MSAATDAFENGILDLVFNNNAFADIGDASGLQPSATAGSLYVSLHTADPGEAGDQTTNECTYTSYARVAVARTSGGWTITANSVSPASNVTFPQATGGSETATHAGIGTDSSGAGVLLVRGAISPNISISSGVTPVIGSGTTISLN